MSDSFTSTTTFHLVLRPEEQVKIRKMVPASTSHALTCALGYALTWALLSPALWFTEDILTALHQDPAVARYSGE